MDTTATTSNETRTKIESRRAVLDDENVSFDDEAAGSPAFNQGHMHHLADVYRQAGESFSRSAHDLSPGESVHSRVTVFPRTKRGDGARGKGALLPVVLDRQLVSSRFHLCLNEAAKSLGIAETTLKQACRKLGLQRWPRGQLPSRLSCQSPTQAKNAQGQTFGVSAQHKPFAPPLAGAALWQAPAHTFQGPPASVHARGQQQTVSGPTGIHYSLTQQHATSSCVLHCINAPDRHDTQIPESAGFFDVDSVVGLQNAIEMAFPPLKNLQEHAGFSDFVSVSGLQNDIEMAFPPLKDLLDPSGK